MTRMPLRCVALLILATATSPAQTLSVDLDTLGLPEATEARLRDAIAQANWPEAEAMLFSLAETQRSSAELLRALAVAHLQCGRYWQAASAYRRADRLETLDRDSRFALATAYLGLEKRHWARRELERLAQEDARNPLYPNALAGIFQQYQWFEMAEMQARRAIALDPDAAEGYDRLGQAQEGRNQAEDALGSYRAALGKDRESKKRSPWPAYHLGRLLLEAGQAAEAAAALEEALDIDPGHVDAIHERAMALRKLERWEDALAALERAAALAPVDARIQYALSQTYRRLGKASEAREAMRRFQALTPR